MDIPTKTGSTLIHGLCFEIWCCLSAGDLVLEISNDLDPEESLGRFLILKIGTKSSSTISLKVLDDRGEMTSLWYSWSSQSKMSAIVRRRK